VVLLVCFVLVSLTSQLEQQVRDFALDRRTERTFTTLVGVAAASRLLRLITALVMAHVVAHLVLGTFPPLLVPFGWLALPLFVHRFVRPPATPRSEWLTRVLLISGLIYVGAMAMRGGLR
jgi:4-hydroxybenzoate polyprenyltransferase